MPLFQYFGWVGSCLLAALFAANWCFSPPIAPVPASDVPLNQRINIRSIRSISGLNAWCSRARVRCWCPKRKPTPRLRLAEGKCPPRRNASPSTRSPRCRLCPSNRVFDRPAPAASPQSGRPRRLRKARHLKSRAYNSAKDLLSPIRFTGRQEEADAFAHERRQLAA
jgi:hypothetical protein